MICPACQAPMTAHRLAPDAVYYQCPKGHLYIRPPDCTCETETHAEHSCPSPEETEENFELHCSCCPACTRDCEQDCEQEI